MFLVSTIARISVRLAIAGLCIISPFHLSAAMSQSLSPKICENTILMQPNETQTIYRVDRGFGIGGGNVTLPPFYGYVIVGEALEVWSVRNGLFSSSEKKYHAKSLKAGDAFYAKNRIKFTLFGGDIKLVVKSGALGATLCICKRYLDEEAQKRDYNLLGASSYYNLLQNERACIETIKGQIR